MSRLEWCYASGAAALLAAALLIAAPHAANAAPFEGLGVDEHAYAAVDEDEMQGARGRYYGVYFSINFSGYWDTLGTTPTAALSYTAGIGGAATSDTIYLTGIDGLTTTTTTGDNGDAQAATQDDDQVGFGDNNAFQATASVGNGGPFQGANGIVQLTQVPGSMNLVTSGLVVNLWVFNVQDTLTPQNIQSLAPYLSATQAF